MPAVSSASVLGITLLEEVNGLDDDGRSDTGTEADGPGRVDGATAVRAVFAFRGGMDAG